MVERRPSKPETDLKQKLLDSLLLDFGTFLLRELGYSPETKKAYVSDTKQFFFITQTSSPFDISRELFHDFIQKMQKKLRPSSLKRKIESLRAFWRFLKAEQIWPAECKPLPETISIPICRDRLPRSIHVEEAFALLKACTKDTFFSFRDRMLVHLLYGHGLRVSEACQLNVEDIRIEFLHVCGKGQKERLIPLQSQFKVDLKMYLDERKALNSMTSAFLINKRKKRLTRDQAWKIIHCLSSLNCANPISPHQLRHSFATHLLLYGASIRVIQEFLGHADISTTERYTHTALDHIQRSFDSFHPDKDGLGDMPFK